MTIRPLRDEVFLRREPPEEVSPGGLILVNASNRRSNYAEVVAVGPRCKAGLAPGDRVLIEKYGGSGDDEIEVDGQKLWRCREGDVLGVCE